MPYTIDTIAELIPNYLDAGWIRAAHEYRRYETVQEETETGASFTIMLMTAKSPTDEFVPRLPVVRSVPGDSAEARNPCPVIEVESKDHYLFYGHHQGGIYALHLNPRNGLAHIEGFGVCVARRPQWMSGAVSQPYVVHNPDTGYYYLFVAYGFSESDSNIRVGRSRQITGPYLDVKGRDLADPDDFRAAAGFMISAGYRFDGSDGSKAPSRPMVFRTEEGKWFFTQETFGCASKEKRFEVRELLWTDNGWPVLSPECYEPASAAATAISPTDLIGHYEFVKLTPSLPQGVLNSVSLSLLDVTMQGVSSTRNSWAMGIPRTAEGRLELGGSMRGSWRLINSRTIEFTYPNYREIYRITQVRDPVAGRTSLALTGKDSNGIACFAKKIELPQ